MCVVTPSPPLSALVGHDYPSLLLRSTSFKPRLRYTTIGRIVYTQLHARCPPSPTRARNFRDFPRARDARRPSARQSVRRRDVTESIASQPRHQHLNEKEPTTTAAAAAAASCDCIKSIYYRHVPSEANEHHTPSVPPTMDLILPAFAISAGAPLRLLNVMM